MRCNICNGNTFFCNCIKNFQINVGDSVKLKDNKPIPPYDNILLKINKTYVIEKIEINRGFTYFYFKNCECKIFNRICHGHTQNFQGENNNFIKVYNV